MSRADNAGSSTSKRLYRKGISLSGAEKQREFTARKRETHKSLNVFIHNAHKEGLDQLCAERGMTQAEMVESLIEQELGKEADPGFKVIE
ncbi:replication regulatory protein RepA [Pantoea sp. GbtcB22]|uniref:replication regulatory protein RepA n=1 Tax=Pantoea sp. GbtcB22 TaxID=2824767 RepID=UPI001C3101B3|nr:replication regulatory protein RepA [Pantoea sp. GbtcB22]